MYLSDLLSALSKNESIELSKPEIADLFQKEKYVKAYQRVALFYKLGLRGWGETKKQIATKVGVSESYIKQHDAMMDWLSPLDDSLQSSILDALCVGELREEGGGKLETSGVYRKLKEGYRPQGIERRGARWYIQWNR